MANAVIPEQRALSAGSFERVNGWPRSTFLLAIGLPVSLWVLAVFAVSAQDIGERSGNQAAAAVALSRSVHRDLGCRSRHSEM